MKGYMNEQEFIEAMQEEGYQRVMDLDFCRDSVCTHYTRCYSWNGDALELDYKAVNETWKDSYRKVFTSYQEAMVEVWREG